MPCRNFLLCDTLCELHSNYTHSHNKGLTVLISGVKISYPLHLIDDYAGLQYEPQMPDLMNEIAVELPDKWQDIGRGLGLSESELKAIREAHSSHPNDLFSAVFNRWYSGELHV